MSKEYSKGYQAGIKRGKAESQRERVFMKCLELVIDNGPWTYGGKSSSDNVAVYLEVADYFTNHALLRINGAMK